MPIPLQDNIITTTCFGYIYNEKPHELCDEQVVNSKPIILKDDNGIKNYHLFLTCESGDQNIIPVYINGSSTAVNTPNLDVYNLTDPKQWEDGTIVPNPNS